MLCKCHWIVLYTVHFTAFCLGGPFFPGHGTLQLNLHGLMSFQPIRQHSLVDLL